MGKRSTRFVPRQDLLGFRRLDDIPGGLEAVQRENTLKVIELVLDNAGGEVLQIEGDGLAGGNQVLQLVRQNVRRRHRRGRLPEHGLSQLRDPKYHLATRGKRGQDPSALQNLEDQATGKGPVPFSTGC